MADENLKKVNADSANLKMATRAENLKKINDELEKLSDEELEEIAGGMNIIVFQSPQVSTSSEIKN